MPGLTPPVPPYAPYAEFRAPAAILPLAAAGLAAAAVLAWSGSGRSRGAERAARRGVALALGGVSIALLRRWLRRGARKTGECGEATREAPADDHLERLLDEAVEETFPASDPIAVHIE